jgi:hypothetical protein
MDVILDGTAQDAISQHLSQNDDDTAATLITNDRNQLSCLTLVS